MPRKTWRYTGAPGLAGFPLTDLTEAELKDALKAYAAQWPEKERPMVEETARLVLTGKNRIAAMYVKSDEGAGPLPDEEG